MKEKRKEKTSQEKERETEAILAELQMLAEIRKTHEWAAVGQQEAQNLEQAEKELEAPEAKSKRKGGSKIRKEAKVTDDELTELLDTAIYKEIAAQAYYLAGQKKTQDPGARALMSELADEELKHAELLKNLKDKGIARRDWHPEKVPDLRISEYLTGSDTLQDAGLQDTLASAIKREELSVGFYSRMMGVLRGDLAKRLCERLVREELKHKFKLETLYDDLFYGGN